MSEREDILARIRALRAKAADAASTEAEALAAASMAAKLLMKFDVEEDELTERDVHHIQDVGVGYKTKTTPEILILCAFRIAEFTETKGYFKHSITTHYIGMPADVEMAIYLSEMLIGACKRGFSAYVEQFESYPRANRLKEIRAGFIHGFAAAVNDRLKELTEERRRAHSTGATGTSIVVVKHSLIKSFMNDNDYHISGTQRSKLGRADYNAYDAGMTAGSKVSLGRPLDSAGDRSAPRLT